MYDLSAHIRPEPRLFDLPEKKLIGTRLKMSLAQDRTIDLWRKFMPLRKQIKNKVDEKLISMQVYEENFGFDSFNEHTVFEKWACVEVHDFSSVPAEFETYFLKGGLYGVFHHRGAMDTAPQTWHYIFKVWLPASLYELDEREHFEVLDENYKNHDQDAEEEVWVPRRVKLRA